MMMMAQKSTTKTSFHASTESKPIFHDFLGMTSAPGAPAVAPPKDSATCGGNGRAPEASHSASLSTTSDLVSERQMGNHLEGVPCYGPKRDLSGPEISNRFTGSKRSNSDSTFVASSRDGFSGQHLVENSHLMKMLKNGAAGDRPRRSSEGEFLYGLQQKKPASASLTLQVPCGSKPNANVSKFDRSLAPNVVTAASYPLRMSQYPPVVHQVPSNKYRDMNSAPSVISQSAAADEGSRTGMKGSGILGSVNACNGTSDQSPSTLPENGSRLKPGAHISDPESSHAPSRHGLTSASRQMTIFYGGQAHVFDDVHPNKADVIMALAGSNGGSWSTTYSPKTAVKSVIESYMPNGVKEIVTASNTGCSKDFSERISVTGNSSHAVGPGDRIIRPSGAPRGCLITRSSRHSIQAGEPSKEDKG